MWIMKHENQELIWFSSFAESVNLDIIFIHNIVHWIMVYVCKSLIQPFSDTNKTTVQERSKNVKTRIHWCSQPCKS